MKKKLVFSVLSTAVLSSMAASAYALSPGFYLGGSVDRYYSITSAINNIGDFADDLVQAGFTNSVYVHTDGQAARVHDIVNNGLNDSLHQPTADDFEDNEYQDVAGGEPKNPKAELEDEPVDPVVPDELEVESVSAIKKSIEINVAAFEPEEGATADVAIFALNEKGEKTGSALVSETGLEIEDTFVVFDVSSYLNFGDGEYLIEVTIGDETKTVKVELQFKEVEEYVKAINDANAAQLATLLANEAYFTGFNIAKVDYYFEKKETERPFKTIAEVQEKVIDAVAADAEFVTFVAKINEAVGRYAKYTLLKATFKYVDDANMDDYMDKNGPIFDDNNGNLEIETTLKSFKEIQDQIDKINLKAAVDGLTVDNTTKPSNLNKYKAALEALQLVNTEVETSGKTKADWLKEINNQLEKIAEARKAADEKIAEAREALATFEKEYAGENLDDVEEYQDLVSEIEKLEKEDLAESDLNTGDLEAALDELKNLIVDITIVKDAKAAMKEFEEAWKAAYNQDYTGGIDAYDDVKANVEVLEDENSQQQDKDDALAELKDNASGSVAALKAETEKLVVYASILKTKSATEMRSLLFELDAGDKYLNLSSAAKLEFAGYVIDRLAEESTPPEDFDELQDWVFTDTASYLEDYLAVIKTVNEASSISEMINALDLLSKEFKELDDAEEKADIAERVLKGVPYETIAQIKEAIGL